MSTLKTSNIQHGSASTAAITLASDSTATLNGLAYPTSGSLTGRNRIINGDMRIDQRNAGAAVTINNLIGVQYGLDRFYGYNSTGTTEGIFTIQQDTTVPAGEGFTHSLKVAVTTADASLSASQSYVIGTRIEGFNVADLNFGTASPAQITLSFWVRSSATGTFGGTLRNGAQARGYIFTYSISSANAWEKKVISLTGDTTGTWITNNGLGLIIDWCIGAGTSQQSTAGSWGTVVSTAPTGQTNLMATNGATFYITGVQLEAGTVATPFERRSYGQELSLCQRYYEKSYNTETAVGSNVGSNTGEWVSITLNIADYNDYGKGTFKVSKRAGPTMTIWSTDGTVNTARQQDTANVAVTVRSSGENNFALGATSNTFTTDRYHRLHWAASAEL